MNINKIILVFIVTLFSMSLFAQNANIGFKDATQTTLNLVRLEDPSYPTGTPVASRWVIRAYLSTDNVIDPLLDGQPSGNDTYLQDISLIFGPTGALGISSAVVPQATWQGAPTYIYLRVFNATSFDAATKYMTFFAPYLITAGGAISVNIMPLYGWDESPVWKPISSGPTEYDLEVTSTPAGIAIYKDGVDTGEVTPFTFFPGEAGTYTLAPIAGYIWNPVSHVVPELTENVTINFVSQWVNVDPLAAINPVPAIGATIQRAWDAGELPVVLSWAPNADGPAPQGYKLYWNGALTPVDLDVATWTTPALGAGPYTWQVVPYINEPVGKSVVKTTLRSVAPSRSSIKDHAKGDAVDCPVWGFSIAYDDAPVIVPPNDPTTVETPGGTVEVTSDVELIVDETVDETDPVIVALPNSNNLVNPIVIGFSGAGVATIEIEVGQGVWFPMIYWGGQWRQGTPFPMVGPGSVFFTGVDFDAKGDVIILISENVDPTLPVELSSFDAVLTAQNFVALTWTSESESEMLGYRVYRAETADVNGALMITPVMIPATNTSTTQTYKVEDHEVYVNNTYYYWLESVDYGTSHFHGPVSVTITGTETPELPVSTVMGNVYPNPFRMGNNANIQVSVKAGETANVTIYNILGQAVKSFQRTEGTHKLEWNGRDSKGNLCGSGIYFYKLSSPSMNQTKKMVIIK